MLLFANAASGTIGGSGITAAAGQVATLGSGEGAEFVGAGGVAPSAENPMRVVLTAVDGNGNDTGAYEIAEITGRSGDDVTLGNRGLEGTAAAVWSSGTRIECRPTAGALWPRLLKAGQGLAGQSSTSNTTFASIVVPAGVLVAGDLIHVRMHWQRSGTVQNSFFDPQLNGTSTLNFTGDAAAKPVTYTDLWISIRSSTVQVWSVRNMRGDGVQSVNSGALAIDLATTPLTIALIARMGNVAENLTLVAYSAILIRNP